jgi:hypothetical protein
LKGLFLVFPILISIRFRAALAAVVALLLLSTGGSGSTDQAEASIQPAQTDEVPAGLNAADWSGIRAQIQAHRHAVSDTADGHRAANLGQQWITLPGRSQLRGVLFYEDAAPKGAKDQPCGLIEKRRVKFAESRYVCGERQFAATKRGGSWEGSLRVARVLCQ